MSLALQQVLKNPCQVQQVLFIMPLTTGIGLLPHPPLIRDFNILKLSSIYLDCVFCLTQRCFAPAKLPPPANPTLPPAEGAVLSQPGSADVASASKPVFCIYDSDETDDESPARQIETLTLGSTSAQAHKYFLAILGSSRKGTAHSFYSKQISQDQSSKEFNCM